MKLWLTLFILTFSTAAQAQSLRLRAPTPTVIAPEKQDWSLAVRYGLATDYADTFSPRDYTNSLSADVSYNFNSNWHVGAELGLHADTVGGEIDKSSEQSNMEALNTSGTVEAGYQTSFSNDHLFSLFIHGEPLWDQPSRMEGYSGIYGGGGALVFNFFSKTYVLAVMADSSELVNTYRDSLDGSPNPDYFVTYKLTNSIRFLQTFRVGYTVGLKTTHYTDQFWGYNYDQVFSLSKSFGNLNVTLAYDNGGFTDNGDVELWYLDAYRRIGFLSMTYTF